MLKNLSERKKNILFIIVALAILIIIAGLFLFWPKDKSKNENFGGGGPEDFVIENNVIENKTEGVRADMDMLEGWRIEKPPKVFSSVWGVHILSPEVEIKKQALPDSYFITKGCVILLNIEESGTFFNAIEDILSSVDNNTQFVSLDDEKSQEIMVVDNRLAFKEITYNRPDAGKRVEVRILLKNDKLVYLAFISSAPDKEYCFGKFNEFLSGVSFGRK